MISSLTPPPSLIDPHLVIDSALRNTHRSQKAVEIDDADDDMDGQARGESSTGIKAEVKKVKDSELQWWQNNVELAAGTRRNERYGWDGVAGKSL